jgi:hypothetical protein
MGHLSAVGSTVWDAVYETPCSSAAQWVDAHGHKPLCTSKLLRYLLPSKMREKYRYLSGLSRRLNLT